MRKIPASTQHLVTDRRDRAGFFDRHARGSPAVAGGKYMSPAVAATPSLTGNRL
jgi:hypothetical protein